MPHLRGAAAVARVAAATPDAQDAPGADSGHRRLQEQPVVGAAPLGLPRLLPLRPRGPGEQAVRPQGPLPGVRLRRGRRRLGRRGRSQPAI